MSDWLIWSVFGGGAVGLLWTISSTAEKLLKIQIEQRNLQQASLDRLEQMSERLYQIAAHTGRAVKEKYEADSEDDYRIE